MQKNLLMQVAVFHSRQIYLTIWINIIYNLNKYSLPPSRSLTQSFSPGASGRFLQWWLVECSRWLQLLPPVAPPSSHPVARHPWRISFKAFLDLLHFSGLISPKSDLIFYRSNSSFVPSSPWPRILKKKLPSNAFWNPRSDSLNSPCESIQKSLRFGPKLWDPSPSKFDPPKKWIWLSLAVRCLIKWYLQLGWECTNCSD